MPTLVERLPLPRFAIPGDAGVPRSSNFRRLQHRPRESNVLKKDRTLKACRCLLATIAKPSRLFDFLTHLARETLDTRPVIRLSSPMFPRTRDFAAAFVLLSGSVFASGQAASLTPEQMKGAARTDDFSIPTPGEFMAALTKLGKPIDWASKSRPPIPTDFPDRGQRALNLGTLVADGYLAVQAESKQEVKNIGKDITALAKGLGVSEELKARGNSLMDFADDGNWDALREELEATQNEVKNKFSVSGDSDLIALVSVGAWVRGTELISGHVAKSYSKEGAQLLRQPAIVEFLAAKLEALPDKLRDEPAVKRARVKLAELKAAVSFPRENVTDQEGVKKIHTLSAELVKDLSKKNLK